MNINKAGYFTIAHFGNLSTLLRKIDLEKKRWIKLKIYVMRME